MQMLEYRCYHNLCKDPADLPRESGKYQIEFCYTSPYDDHMDYGEGDAFFDKDSASWRYDYDDPDTVEPAVTGWFDVIFLPTDKASDATRC